MSLQVACSWNDQHLTFAGGTGASTGLPGLPGCQFFAKVTGSFLE